MTVSWFPMISAWWGNLIFFSETTNEKCTQGSSCSTHQECGKNGSCNSKLGCICKCKKLDSVCTNHHDCDVNSWCKPKSGLCACKNPKKCIHGSACKRSQHVVCGKKGVCHEKWFWNYCFRF